MIVEFINKEYLKENFYKMWGLAATVCYNTDPKYAINVGKTCLNSGHFSGSRGLYFTFKISEIPRSCIDQLVRHEIGVFKNVQSFRYVSKDNFTYYTPQLILDCPEALEKYNMTMENLSNSYVKLQNILRSYYKEDLETEKLSNEHINQSARGIIPMNTNSELVIGFTLEALIHLTELRLCSRAEEPIRKLVSMIRKEVIEIFPELSDFLNIKCIKTGYCNEGKKCCGLRPVK